ncbi:MAG: hypothetical protein IPL27_27090 [Lewinellaceae bacterium]|nr:hypothetical protein [Lewinellaceae bacterium]
MPPLCLIWGRGTKIALSGQHLPQQRRAWAVWRSGTVPLRKPELPAINMGLRGLQGDRTANQATRVRFD